MTISTIAQSIQDSPTIAIAGKARALRLAGHKIIDLGIGNLSHEPSKVLKKALKKAVQEKNTAKYLPAGGLTELKKQIINLVQRQSSIEYKDKEVLVTVGAKSGIFEILLTLLNKGDEVILPTPYRPSYGEQVVLAGGKAIVVQSKKDCHLEIDAIAKKITKKTKLIILNSPNNPSGIVYTKDELHQILQIATKHNLYIISDEMYQDFVYDKIKHISISQIASNKQRDRIIVISGFSKNLAIPGRRLGYVLGAAKIIQTAEKIQSNIIGNAPSVEQFAVADILEKHFDPFVAKVKKDLARNRKRVIQFLEKQKIKYVHPNGALYFLIHVGERDSTAFCDNLLKHQKVVAVPGVYFGQEGYIRICYATKYDIVKQGIKLISQAIKK